ncbi:MAG: HigA family addiction module antitoxin [Rhodospirillales bacterium]|nr:HigA family addiction module antitoxin [Rhodospirillales bacterium]
MSKRNPTHPGESIADAMREARMSATELAAALGMERGNLYRLLRGRIAVSPHTAVALEAVGRSNAEFWCRRQALYKLARYRDGIDA